jgi:CheY-like chemotaxis protein
MVKKILLIENEPAWIARLQSALSDAGFNDVVTCQSYANAEREIPKLRLEDFAFALVDVRMRRPVFDQGGLALLDVLKSIAPSLPVVMLTAYAHDYPALQQNTSRYRHVLAYEKEVFLESRSAIIAALLQPLPAQLGESPPFESVNTAPASHVQATAHSGVVRGLSHIFIGACCIVFVLGSGLATFILLDRFSQFSKQGNVIFGLVVICVMAVLIAVFGKETIELAARHSRNWLKAVLNVGSGRRSPRRSRSE